MIHSRKDSFTTQFLQIMDAALVFLAFYIATVSGDFIRDLLSRPTLGNYNLGAMAWVLYITVPLTPIMLARFGFYQRLRHKPTSKALKQLFRAGLIITLVISVFALFAKVDDARRLVLGLGGVLVFFFIFTRDRLVRYRASRRRIKGTSRERVIIAGCESEVRDFIKEIDPEILSDWKVVAHFDMIENSADDLFNLLKNKSIGRVIFANKDTPFQKVADAIEVCELQGVEAWIAASFVRTQIARPVFDSVGDKPMLVLRSTPELSWELLAKALMDRLGAIFILFISAPLWLVAAIGIRWKSPGAPVFFSQMRAGKYGEPFRMWKFRTMVADAEAQLEQLKLDHGNEMDGPVFKLGHDPRIFKFGAFLRKFSIDELPQLLNVVTGEMSLVGPRPLPVYEVDAFNDISHRRRLSVKPGITCEWQVGGRNTIKNFDDWVAMDLRYIDNWSLWLDLKILIRTVPAVIFGRGAK